MDEVIFKEVRNKVTSGEYDSKVLEGSPWKKGNPDAIFPRAFRWVLTSKEHPKIHWWMNKLNTDLLNRTIDLVAYEDSDSTIFNWIQSILEERSQEILLDHLDPSGNSLFVLEFTKLKITEHSCGYDYASSEVLSHRLKISFEQVKRTKKS